MQYLEIRNNLFFKGFILHIINQEKKCWSLWWSYLFEISWERHHKVSWKLLLSREHCGIRVLKVYALLMNSNFNLGIFFQGTSALTWCQQRRKIYRGARLCLCEFNCSEVLPLFFFIFVFFLIMYANEYFQGSKEKYLGQ